MLAWVLLVLLALFWFLKDWLQYYKLGSRLPSPSSFSLLGLGHAHVLYKTQLKDVLEVFRGLKADTPSEDLMAVWMGPVLVVFLNNPADLLELLNSGTNLRKGFAYTLTKRWLGNGLLTMDGGGWHDRRRLLNRAFHTPLLQGFVPIFSSQARVLADILASKCSQPSIDLEPLVALFSLDVVAETAISVKLEAQVKECQFAVSVKEICDCIMIRSMKVYLRPDFIFDLSPLGRHQKKHLAYVKDFVAQIIKNKKEEHSKKENVLEDSGGEDPVKKRRTLIDLLIETQDQSGLTDDDIQDEVNTFMFAGHDTTACCISYTLYQLSKNPAIQERVYEEVVSVVGARAEVTYADLAEMPYLELVIKEALRLHSPVPVIGRALNTSLTLPSGHILPAGCNVFMLLYDIHRNSAASDPAEFRPERFVQDPNLSFYFPFSTGFRNCIGQKFALLEAKACVAQVIRKLRLKEVEGHQVHPVPAVVLRSHTGLPVSVSLR